MSATQKKRAKAIRDRAISKARIEGYYNGCGSTAEAAQRDFQSHYDSFQKRISELQVAKKIADMAADESTASKLEFAINILSKSTEELFKPDYRFKIKKKTDPNIPSFGFTTSGTCSVGH